jgi:lipopolysaccharide cholinephosphotransferase
MSGIDSKVLRKAQLIMLDMLLEFDAICTKHKLLYWLDSGTLLGAVRHKGFIPWDDDIDISMPYEDYKKFQEIAKQELSKDIFLQSKESDSAFLFDYTKLRSNRASIVEFHEKSADVAYHQGVFVDIFPMLTVPNSDFYKDYYKNIFHLIRQTSAVSLHTPNGANLPDVRQKLVQSLQLMHQGWESNENLVIYGGEMPDVAAYFEYKEIFPLSQVEFEGHKFSAPKNPHHYLGAIYSFNYMELPPIDKRTIHAHEMRV